MEEVIIKAKILDRDQMRELNARRVAPGAWRLGLQFAAYLVTGVGLVWAASSGQPGWVLVLALMANALVQFGFFGMLHEACHRTIFPSKAMNDAAGWVAALAHPMSPALMRAFHYEHHRYTHVVERDPELAQLEFMVDWPRHLMWVATMSGLPIVFARLYWTSFAALVPTSLGAWQKVLPFVRPDARARVAWEARALLLVHAGTIAAALLWLPALAWIYAGLVLGHSILSLYITCEHRGLPAGAEVPILAKTRSIRVPSFVRWLLWNMPFHAEHHAWPSVPFYNLPALHEAVREHLVHRESLVRLHLTGGRGQGPRLVAAERDAEG